MEFLINGANIIYLVSYAVRDILWLRILTVIAAGALIAYFYQLAEPLYTAMSWNLVFIALNLYWIVRLIRERRPVTLQGNDLRLYQLAFRSLTPREMAQLLKLGEWLQADPETCFIRQGESLDKLMVICSGTVCIIQDGQRIEELGPGQFIGGEAYISDTSAPADVVAIEPTYYMCWHKHDLQRFIERHTDLNAALTLTMGFDIAKRLQAFQRKQQYGEVSQNVA